MIIQMIIYYCQSPLIVTLVIIILAVMFQSNSNEQSENQAYSLLLKHIPEYLNPQQDQELLTLSISEASNLVWQSIASKLDTHLYPQVIDKNKFLKSLKKIENGIQPLITMIKKEKVLQKNLLKSLQEIKMQLKTVVQGQVKQYEEQKCARQHLLRVEFQQKIIMIDYQIFTSTLIGISPSIDTDQTNKWDLFDLIFQHPYPRKTLPEHEAKKILGASLFYQKIKKYQQLKKKNWFLNQNIIVCHGCLQPPSDFYSLYVCTGECANSDVAPCFITDPYLYYKKYINGLEYLIEKDRNRMASSQSQKYLYPYLIYYKNEQRKPCCGRVFCQKCQSMLKINAPQEPGQTNSCPYCSGQCSCFRCRKVDTLVKMLAFYKQYNGNLEQLIKKLLFNVIEKEDKLKYSKQLKKILSKGPKQQFKKWVKVLRQQLGCVALQEDYRSDTINPYHKIIKYYPKVRDAFSIYNQKRQRTAQKKSKIQARKLKRAQEQERKRQADKQREENSYQQHNQYVSSSDQL